MVWVFTYWILECLLAPAPPCPLLGRWLDACLIYPRWTLLVVEPGLYPLFPGWTHHHQYSPNLPLASNCSLVWQGERAVPLNQSLDRDSLLYHVTSGGLPTLQPCTAVFCRNSNPKYSKCSCRQRWDAKRATIVHSRRQKYKMTAVTRWSFSDSKRAA